MFFFVGIKFGSFFSSEIYKFWKVQDHVKVDMAEILLEFCMHSSKKEA